jgi:hypothetical protein
MSSKKYTFQEIKTAKLGKKYKDTSVRVFNSSVNKNAKTGAMTLAEVKGLHEKLKAKYNDSTTEIYINGQTLDHGFTSLKNFASDDITFGDQYMQGTKKLAGYNPEKNNFLYVDFFIRHKVSAFE